MIFRWYYDNLAFLEKIKVSAIRDALMVLAECGAVL
jgi:hypothetical protein